MSQLINNSQNRRETLKHLILQLHKGEAPEIVRNRLIELLRNIPYNEVVIVEQELIAEGLLSNFKNISLIRTIIFSSSTFSFLNVSTNGLQELSSGQEYQYDHLRQPYEYRKTLEPLLRVFNRVNLGDI
ncbi:MAG: DUF438 domain-containing protein [Dysgonomonas sp.]